MKLTWVLLLLLAGFVFIAVVTLAALYLFGGPYLSQLSSMLNLGGKGPDQAGCIQQDQLCGYGTANSSTLVANQSTFYGKCCASFACVGGYCRKPDEQCVAKNQFCGYGPTSLAHYDAPTYYGECCEGECTNGYCKPVCKTSGSCNNTLECCSGLECTNGQCRQPCKTSGSCASNLDCCGGYSCTNGTCKKPCMTSGPCSTNSDCCSGFFCGPNMQCTAEPKCVQYMGSCNNTGQCCSSLTCVDGACANTTCKWGTVCNSTSECCSGLYCGQSGICNIQKCTELGGTCNTTDDCCFRRKCENNTCVNKTCATLNESCISFSCCSGLTCMNYKCVTPCKISGVCLRDSDCCSNYYCSPAGYCAKLAECTFEYGSCTNSSQCCSGLTCTNGACSKPCKTFGACSSNTDCCVGFFCNASSQCTLQSTQPQSNYDLCERQCTQLGYNNWFCDPETSCGMYGSHLASGDSGCPTAYHDWSYPNNEYCCCTNHTQYDCNSACQRSGYNNGWGTVANGAACGEVDGVIPVDGAVCCCYSIPQPQQNWYCCYSDSVGYTCSQNLCPPPSQLISGPYSTQQNCLSNCTSQGQCSIGTPECASSCLMIYGTPLSVCGAGSCPSGYSQAMGPDGSNCSQHPPCDRCCCQTAGLPGSYNATGCQGLSQSLGFTHSLVSPDGHFWYGSECYYNATAHCQQYHNGASAPNGGSIKNCCYWYCSGEPYNPPNGYPPPPP